MLQGFFSMEKNMKKSFGDFVIKSLDEDKRIFKGIASTPSQDRSKDVMVPNGAKFTLPMPLLLHHNHTMPVGLVTKAEVTSAGIEVEIYLPEVNEEGVLKSRVDEAFQSLKLGLIKGLSVGFLPNFDKAEMIKGGGVQFNDWDWYELSLVTIPCNPEAETDFKKEFDEYKAALGEKKVEVDETETENTKVKSEHTVVKLISPAKGGVTL